MALGGIKLGWLLGCKVRGRLVLGLGHLVDNGLRHADDALADRRDVVIVGLVAFEHSRCLGDRPSQELFERLHMITLPLRVPTSDTALLLLLLLSLSAMKG